MGKSPTLCICILMLVLFVPAAFAEHVSFQDSETPPAFLLDYLVTDESDIQTVLTVTLAGDCTLGGTEAANRKADGFVKTVLEKGLDYPFSGLEPLFSQDDVTFVNLEGVLSDSSKGENTDKNFAFRGPSSFAKLLPLGSIEAVNISNNHYQDYGNFGSKATLKALEEYGVAYAGEEWLSIFSLDGGKIGLAGIRGSLSEEKKRTVVKQIALLRQAGCQIIIYALHAGQEYAQNHNRLQEDMAHFLIDSGADVVAGHHPHVVQGLEIYKDRLILYSLGNFVFGGNHDPKETGALVARVEFSLRDGMLKQIQAALHPVLFTGDARRNVFKPILLAGKQAEKVIKKVQLDTNFDLPDLVDGSGVILPPIILNENSGGLK